MSMLGVDLEIIEGPMKGLKYFVCKERPVEIGRSRSSDFPILDDHRISRRHSRISIEDGVCLLEDIGSKNGTLFNGERITQKTRLELPGVFVIGDTSIRVSQVNREVSEGPLPEDDARELKKQLDKFQRENAELKEKLADLHQRIKSPQAMNTGLLKDILLGSPVEDTEYVLKVFHRLYRFVLDVEQFTVALVHSLLTRAEATGILRLPPHSKDLRQLMDQLLKKDSCESEKEIEKYLQDLNNWLIALVVGYRDAAPQWFGNLWKRINPRAIEKNARLSTGKRLFGLTEGELWAQYKASVQDLGPELAQDEIGEVAAKIVRKWIYEIEKGCKR